MNGRAAARGQGRAAPATGRGRGSTAGPDRETPPLLCPNHGLEVISLVSRCDQLTSAHPLNMHRHWRTEMQASSAHISWQCMQPHHAELMVC